MKHTVTKGIASSYVITVHVEKNDRDDLHSKALQSLQSEVKVPGFRPGHVPLHMVEKQIKPEYLRMAFLEEILHKSLNDLMKDHDDKKFIGQPYDLKDEENGDTLVVTYKLDTYPEAEITNADWKKLTIAPVDTTVNEKEIEQAMTNLQRQYADYEDAETVNNKTLIKAKYTILDKDGTELHKGNAYLSDAEYQEFPNLLTAVDGKKKGDVIDIKYDEKKFPHVLHYHPHTQEEGHATAAKTLQLTLIDCKNTILPDFNDEAVLKKLFQSPDITNKEQLIAKISSVLGEQKEEQGLLNTVENMLNEARKSLSVMVPETIVREEMAARVKALGEKMGGEEGLKQYIAKMGEAKTNELYDDIRKSAQESLEKFFILRKLVELLEIADVDWNKHLDAEKKLYDKLVGEKKAPAKKAAKKEETEEEAPKAKKPAAKKTTKKAE